MNIRQVAAIAAAGVLGCAMASGAQAQVRSSGGVTTLTLPHQLNPAASGIDFAHARPLPMPSTRAMPLSDGQISRSAVDPLVLFGRPGVSPGGAGNGEQNPIRLVAPQKIPEPSGVEPDEFGTAGQPYTTSRVNLYPTTTTANYYPYRASGKLFFKIGTSSFLCSASLIKPGLVVTAAHCVANYGKRQFYSGWIYVPAYNNGSAPYGTWSAAQARVLTNYFAGTDSCAQFGVICPDDVAVIALNAQSGRYAGTTTGWFGYGYNGYSYNGSGQAHISQLGYPVALDGGLQMQRDDSQGFVNTGLSRNTIIGSLMTGGSSGGPWVVNLGQPPALNGTSFGTYASHNIVVGVTSWGYTNTAVKQQGASPFTSGNIVVLVNAQCSATPAVC
jgi:hypothetical protein